MMMQMRFNFFASGRTSGRRTAPSPPPWDIYAIDLVLTHSMSFSRSLCRRERLNSNAIATLCSPLEPRRPVSFEIQPIAHTSILDDRTTTSIIRHCDGPLYDPASTIATESIEVGREHALVLNSYTCICCSRLPSLLQIDETHRLTLLFFRVSPLRHSISLSLWSFFAFRLLHPARLYHWSLTQSRDHVLMIKTARA
jgi:hypothetical protein